MLADEVLTPDSSRFWPADDYEPGRSQPSFDKQYVRDWLDSTGWDHTPPGPELPDEVVQNTRAKYVEAYEQITDNVRLSSPDAGLKAKVLIRPKEGSSIRRAKPWSGRSPRSVSRASTTSAWAAGRAGGR